MTTVWPARHGEVRNPAGLLYGRMPRIRLSHAGRLESRRIFPTPYNRPATVFRLEFDAATRLRGIEERVPYRGGAA
jgi:hypothetical protein